MRKIFFLILLMTIPFPALAAEISFVPASQSGSSIEVQLLLDTQGDFVNAVEGVIQFPAQRLALESISDGNSIVNLWIKKPIVHNSGRMEFAGVIPGGIRIDHGTLLKLRFKVLQGGTAELNLVDSHVYRNDAQATELPLHTQAAQLSLEQGTGELTQSLVLDFTPPEHFIIYHGSSPHLFDGHGFISFITQDKESGVDHYEIQENFLGLPSEWRTVENPYQLSVYSYFSIIKVKAVDAVGHERIETTYFVGYLLSAFVTGVIGIVMILIYSIRRLLAYSRGR